MKQSNVNRSYGKTNDKHNRVFSRPSCMPVVAMEMVGQTNQRSVTGGVHYIMLIRPPQALSLVRIYRKPFIFKNIF